MTGQIADHFAQRKIVATDEFLEGTGDICKEHEMKEPVTRSEQA